MAKTEQKTAKPKHAEPLRDRIESPFSEVMDAIQADIAGLPDEPGLTIALGLVADQVKKIIERIEANVH